MKKHGGYTLEELQEHFKLKRISQGFIPKVDFNKVSDENIEVYSAVNKTLNSAWNPLSREMGLKISHQNYSEDNPLMAMRDGLGNMLGEKGIEMLDNKNENNDFWNMINQLCTVIDTEEKAQELLNNTVEMAIQTMEYSKIAEIIQQNPTHEDYNPKNNNNLPAKDFEKRYNHTRTNTKMVSLEQMQDVENTSGEVAINAMIDTNKNLAEEVETNISKYNFWTSLSEQDKQILELKMQGKTQKEIAEELGYKTHSAIGKRLQILKEQLIDTMK